MPICKEYNIQEGFEIRSAFPNMEGVIPMWRLIDIRKPDTPITICEYKEKPKEMVVKRDIKNYREWGGDDGKL